MLPSGLLQKLTTWILALPVLSIFWIFQAKAQEQSSIHFETHVRGILKTHCFHCHGEAEHREAGLDLRLVHLMKTGGESGSAIAPGSASDSLLLKRIESGEMPPGGKTIPDAQKEILRRWLDSGALTKRPEPQTPAPEDWTEEERNYWLFQPVASVKVPPIPVDQVPSANSPLDAFILEKISANRIPIAPDADRLTLIRRLSFDLLGVAPTQEECSAFLADTNIDAYERLVDRLLADPRYGEHWGRHWLDVAGYADSDGYSEQDTLRPWAWQFRDYVIDSFNSDEPYDQFVINQLAGDELVPQPWENLTSDQHSKLAATGFLRTAPDGTEHNGVDQNVARNDVIADTIKIVSSSFLGLTVGCAQCHDHRYDPISQRDYYRIRALLEPGLDWKNWRGKGARLVNLWDAQERQKASEVDKELAELETKRLMELDGIVEDIFQKELMKLPEEQREAAKLARSTPADKRTEDQQKLMRDFPSLNVDRGSATLYDGARINEFNKKYETMQSEIKTKRPEEVFLAGFSEVPHQIPVTYLFNRGDFQQPKDPVNPGGLSILGEHDKIAADDPTIATSGRRLQFAKMLTQGVHPLLTRSYVNRTWMHHFGRAIASNPGELGLLGERPTHPELLDWLARELVQTGWSRKRLSREILTSATYRRSSNRPSGGQDTDPQNIWLGRTSVRRLQSESVRDAMMDAAGMLTWRMHGAPSNVNPDEVGQFIIGNATRDGNGILVAKHAEIADSYRRSIYVQVRRSMPLGVIEPFDPAGTSPNCDRRSQSTVATQSLMLMNNSSVVRISEHFAKRVAREAGEDPAAQVLKAWQLAYGTNPSDGRRDELIQWLNQQRTVLSQPNPDPPSCFLGCVS
ncbi:MAG: PSD1 and planctomycete cytochrome C domain-containing protein [Pirellula sp.]